MVESSSSFIKKKISSLVLNTLRYNRLNGTSSYVNTNTRSSALEYNLSHFNPVLNLTTCLEPGQTKFDMNFGEF